MKIKKFLFLFLQLHVFFVLPAVQTMIQKGIKKTVFRSYHYIFRTTFKPFLSICDFIGFFYTFNFFIIFYVIIYIVIVVIYIIGGISMAFSLKIYS